ncbi:hypothetical protein IAT38_000582 [Cryptococcus sp. DSM 104549]
MRPFLPLLKGKGSASSSRWLARQSRDPYVRQRSPSSDNQPAYRSRSSFKLVSLAKAHPILGKDTKSVVDLGAAPGGWSQVAAKLLGLTKGKGKADKGEIKMEDGNEGAEATEAVVQPAVPAKKPRAQVWAVDILPIEPLPAVHTIQGDFLSSQVRSSLEALVGKPEEGGGVDTVLSDMMAPMTGVRTRDVGLSLELCAAATVFARGVLRRAGEGEKTEVVRGKKVWPGGNLVMKFFAHPDLDEFKKFELDPWFGKVVVEKPKESRSESSEAYWVCLGFKGDPAGK